MPDFDSIGWYGQAMAALAAAMVFGKLHHQATADSLSNICSAFAIGPVQYAQHTYLPRPNQPGQSQLLLSMFSGPGSCFCE